VGALEGQLGLAELKIKWVPVTVQNRFDAVAKGQADMECGSSTVTLGRMKTVDFSSFTFVDGTGLLVKASLAANALGDLGGKKIGVIGGASNERALNEALKRRVINATVVPLKSSDEGLAQVESGAIDAFASDRVLLMALAGSPRIRRDWHCSETHFRSSLMPSRCHAETGRCGWRSIARWRRFIEAVLSEKSSVAGLARWDGREQ
jgi:ABC-type amino acid transport substrate-binding protein